MPTYVSVYVTFPHREAARDLSKRLLDAELVACANALPMESLYTWEGEVVEDEEVAVFLKTRRDLVEDVVALVEMHHPYDVPCVVAFPIEAGSPAYLDWIASVTRS